MKTVFFTGATGGLGSLCVRALSESGRWLVFAGGTNGQKLEEMGALKNVIPVKVDVTDAESVRAAHDAVMRHTDRLDAVANFAGLSSFCAMVEGDSIGVAERLLDVNVLGAVRVNRIFFDLIEAGSGRILNCSSEAGWMTPQPFAAPYFASKRALEAYSRSLRRELMFLGIPVVILQPGAFDTSLTQNLFRKYDETLESTEFFGDVLTEMRPLMAWGASGKNDPARLVRTVLKALEAKRPKLRYRVGTGKMLALLELLPEGAVDRLYRLILGRKLRARRRRG